ncbi:MAG TPA: ABC transporter permease subunit [Candidatus Deferrimicrobiaceae bacterium]|nr:ABC transporter permease subunit [Candidatus Deferrimicrobiaceae bacterium]
MGVGTARSASSRTVALPTPDLGDRLFGFGSVFGKTFRDSRRTALVVGLLLAFILVVTAAAVAAEFDTAQKRLAIAAQMAALPAIFQGMLGEMIAIDRLGGFLSWRTINFLPIILGIWTVVAMSGLLAGELARGSLEFLATTPRTRARLALEKAGGFVLALAVTSAFFAVAAYVAIAAFGTLPSDPVGIDAVAGHTVWVFVTAFVPGAVAFAAGPFLGRGGALALGGITLFASFIISGYASAISFFESLEPVSYFALTAGHRPIAGVWDWPSVALVGAIALALLGVGVVAFAWRDLIVPTGGRVRFPTLSIFLSGPLGRGLGERLPASLIWGAGLGFFGLIISFSVDEFVETLSGIPQIVDLMQRFFPDANILSAAGLLQLVLFSEAILFVSVSAAVLVAGWASDEGERRLELLLSVPMTRAGWALRSGLAVMAGIAIITALMVLGVVLGTSTQAAAGDIGSVAVGVSVLGLYGMALAGIGLAVGGLVRPGLAAATTLVLAIGFFLWELIGSIVGMPDELLDLALNRHLGQPILGQYDWPGMVACAILAFGGIALCALGMRRRDIG